LPGAPVLPKIAKIENHAEIVESLIRDVRTSRFLKPSAFSGPPRFKGFGSVFVIVHS